MTSLTFIFVFLLGSSFLLSFIFSCGFYYYSLVLFFEFDLGSLFSTVGLRYLVLMDWMSLLFISVVSLISLVVMIYSWSYMSLDPLKNKFYALVFLFVISMFLMVLSPNILSILLGWDGLGLVSYGLVIYYQNWKSSSAGMVTILSNRLGDLAIILSICWSFNLGSTSLFDSQVMYSNHFSFNTFVFLVVFAAMTKSAQIPFSAWLPAAMAAPTPVSSLVHSSTLVTAGVYLLIRFNFGLMNNYYLLIISILTMLMSGLSAMFEMDMKKIIALSTLSQLGVMMFVLSLGLKEMSFFHLVTHALFKSLLFLCAGFFIHSNLSWQDSRFYSKSFFSFPVFSTYFSIASLSLSGFPFLAGFYSKDLIVEYFFSLTYSPLLFFLVVFSTGLTLTYSLRLIYLLFGYNSNKTSINGGEDWIMSVPMFILFLLSIFFGSFLSWMVYPMLFVSLPLSLKVLLLPLLFVLFFLMSFYENINTPLNMSHFISIMWNMPFLTTNMFMFFMNKSIKYSQLFDQGWLELFGGQGLNYFISYSVGSDKYNLMNVKFITSTLMVIFFSLFIIFI